MRLNPLERRLRPRSLEIGSRRGRGALASKDGVVKPISAYRAKLYCLIFSLAALYNIAFGLWACLWPRAFFTSLAMAPPNYPGLWQCLGMVVGLYGVLYASAALRLEAARLIIAVGLTGKILGPIGLCLTIQSGEWPLRTFSLVAFNDLIWWLPFVLFLLEGTHIGARLRAAAPWFCLLTNAAAALVMWLLLREGTEAIAAITSRAAYIAEHAAAWRTGWGIWMLAGLSLVAFYAWWGAWLPSSRLAIAAFLVASVGLACDFFAESLFIGWLPKRIESIAPVGSLLTGGAANACYTAAGVMLTLGSPFLRGPLRAGAWVLWASGFALTICTLAGSVTGMIISTAALMTLLCLWVAAFGWQQRCSEENWSHI